MAQSGSAPIRTRPVKPPAENPKKPICSGSMLGAAGDADVPSDQNSPYWPKNFWSPLKFFPLDIAPGSYINFGGGDRERVDTSATLSLASRHAETRLMTCIVFCLRAISHIGDTFRTFIQF